MLGIVFSSKSLSVLLLLLLAKTVVLGVIERKEDYDEVEVKKLLLKVSRVVVLLDDDDDAIIVVRRVSVSKERRGNDLLLVSSSPNRVGGSPKIRKVSEKREMDGRKKMRCVRCVLLDPAGQTDRQKLRKGGTQMLGETDKGTTSWVLPITAVAACGRLFCPIYETSKSNLHKRSRAPKNGEPLYNMYQRYEERYLGYPRPLELENLPNVFWGTQKGISVSNIEFVCVFFSFRFSSRLLECEGSTMRFLDYFLTTQEGCNYPRKTRLWRVVLQVKNRAREKTLWRFHEERCTKDVRRFIVMELRIL